MTGANTQPREASARINPLMANAHANDVYCAIRPTNSDPPIEPKSAIIWKVATAVPPRDLLPTTSATAALLLLSLLAPLLLLLQRRLHPVLLALR